MKWLMLLTFGSLIWNLYFLSLKSGIKFWMKSANYWQQSTEQWRNSAVAWREIVLQWMELADKLKVEVGPLKKIKWELEEEMKKLESPAYKN